MSHASPPSSSGRRRARVVAGLGLLAVLAVVSVAGWVRRAWLPGMVQRPLLEVQPAGWVAQQRFGNFLVTNRGPTLVILTPRFRLDTASATGWTTITNAFLPSGGYLNPRQSVHLTVPVPPGTNAVRLVIHIQPSRRGAPGEWLRNTTVSLLERLGVSPMVPQVFEVTGPPLVRPPVPEESHPIGSGN